MTTAPDLLNIAASVLHKLDADSLDPRDAIAYASALANIASGYAPGGLAVSAPPPNHAGTTSEIASEQLGQLRRIALSGAPAPEQTR